MLKDDKKISNVKHMTKLVFNKKISNMILTEEEEVFDRNILFKMWSLIENTKVNCNYNSQKQYDNLVKELKKIKPIEVKQLRSIWESIHSMIINNDSFISLSNDLCIYGDDSIFMDFGNWMVSQGESVCLNFFIKGKQSVIEYININNISKSNYSFECMAYAFH